MSVSTKVWNRLQCLSCEDAFRQWVAQGKPKRGVYPSDDVKENVEILGRGDEAEIKSRVYWYIMVKPVVFDTCSKRGWKLR